MLMLIMPINQYKILISETLDTQIILDELSELGTINTLEFLATYFHDKVGLIRLTFENTPKILPRTRWIRAYTRCQSETTCTPMDIDNEPIVTNAIHVRPIAPSSPTRPASPPPRREDSATLGEEGTEIEDATRIFFKPKKDDTTFTLLRTFGRFGNLDYIYTATPANSEQIFGYARYENPLSARLVREGYELPQYRCRQGNKPKLSKRELEDPNYRQTKVCMNCAMRIETKMEPYHKQICQHQKERPADLLKYIRKHRRCSKWVLAAKIAKHKRECRTPEPEEQW